MAVEPQMPVNTVEVAYRGQKVNLDNYPSKDKLPNARDLQDRYKIPTRNIDYEPEEIDFTDLLALNTEISKLRVRVHQVRNDYKKAKRISTHLKWVYESSKKRDFIQLSSGTEKIRDAVAEIMNEDKYTEFIVADTLATELKDMSSALRTELDALKELSNNLRRQIDLK